MLNSDVEAALANLKRSDIIGRIWRKDHTVWKADPTEIANRLGWLTATELMAEQIPALQSFAQEVKETGFRHVVLLGMGGSSLGAEVLRQTLGSTGDYPELIMLDSTLPEAVQAVADVIDVGHTLFIISSKSGTTVEPLVLLEYFKSQLEPVVGKERASRHLVAITDAGTPLDKMAKADGFRRTFLNPPDIGGRYSVLSYFGLVPATLIGIDIATLLDRVDRMKEGCASCVPVHENPGAWLGAYIGALALRGRDKLTLVTSPPLNSFGLWVEQLIAESTGKEGKGIIPIFGEPLVDPAHYGNDRLFIYLRLAEDDDPRTDKAIEGIKASGQPVIKLEMRDKYDLGAEFFRWEFATAVSGAIIGINPFDQPDVKAAKDTTESILDEYTTSRHLPSVETGSSMTELLAEAETGRYLAILAYVRQLPEIDRVLADLRREVVEKKSMATMLGYGPRYLHSTGQLHKGGPAKGLFLQITAGHEIDIPIPGRPYTLGVVADAQALGDLRALKSTGQDVIRVHLDRADVASISKLVDKITYRV